MKENQKNVFIKVTDELPKVKRRNRMCSASKLLICRDNKNEIYLTKFERFKGDDFDPVGSESWVCNKTLDDIGNVTHWCDCIPELPSENKE